MLLAFRNLNKLVNVFSMTRVQRLNMRQLMIIALLGIFLLGCHPGENSKKNTQMQTVTATLKSMPTELYYSGTIGPIDVDPVISPADGNVAKIYFKYGQRVTKGQLLMVISSTKLQQDYRTALTDYLKAHADFLNNSFNYQGAMQLKNAQIMSQQEFSSEQEQYENSRLTYIIAKNALEQTIQKMPSITQPTQLEKLTIDDIATISGILHQEYDNLNIESPAAGVVLLPSKTDNTSGDSSSDGSSDSSDGGDSGSNDKSIRVGSQVKEQQALVAIGDLSGLSTTMQVSELVINKIKPQLPVMVTVEALPDITFKGIVKAVGAQAQTSAEGGQSSLATFPVTVVVPTVTPQQSQLIRVGMTAKVQITLPNPAQIMIPIAAVYQKDGQSTVTVIDPETQKTHAVAVTTGQTTLADVAILQGLKARNQCLKV